MTALLEQSTQTPQEAMSQRAAAPFLAAVPFAHPALTRRITDWRQADQIHQAVMSLFREDLPGPQDERRAASHILYRVEHQATRILVQSTTPPQRTDYGIKVIDLTGLIARLQPGTHVRFSLDINAVRCQARTHVRTPVPDHELPTWLAERLTPALAEVTIHDSELIVRRTERTPLRIARITGTGCVNDASMLLDAMRNGVGRAKAYGCGLLTVLPAIK